MYSMLSNMNEILSKEHNNLFSRNRNLNGNGNRNTMIQQPQQLTIQPQPTHDTPQYSKDYYTIPEKVVYNTFFYFIYNSSDVNADNKYALYSIQEDQMSTHSKQLSTFIPNTHFGNLVPCYDKGLVGANCIFDNAGVLYVCIDIANIIYKYNAKIKLFEKFIIKNIYSPSGIVFDNDNNLYVSNFALTNESYPCITVFDANGIFLYEIFSELLASPGDIKKDKKGDFFILNGKAIDLPSDPKLPNFNPNSKYNGEYLLLQVIPNNNTLTGTVNVFSYNTLKVPGFIAFDSCNNGYVTNFADNSISIVNMKTGEADIYFPKGSGLSNPRGIAIDKQDNIYVTYSEKSDNQYKIQKIDKNKYISTFTTQNLNNPRGISFDKNDNLFITNEKGNITRVICNRFIFNISKTMMEIGNHSLLIYDNDNSKTISKQLNIQILRSNSDPIQKRQPTSVVPVPQQNHFQQQHQNQNHTQNQNASNYNNNHVVQQPMASTPAAIDVNNFLRNYYNSYNNRHNNTTKRSSTFGPKGGITTRTMFTRKRRF